MPLIDNNERLARSGELCAIMQHIFSKAAVLVNQSLPVGPQFPDISALSSSDSTYRYPRRSWLMLLCTLSFLTMAQRAIADPVYRYEDRGLITYQDRAPDSRQDDGHSILNNQGVVLRKILSRQGRVDARKRKDAKERALVRDRALLATFTTEEDLIRTRDDRLGMIDGLINRLDDRIRILSERLAVVDKRVQMQEESLGSDKAQESLYAEQRSIKRNIENAWSLIDARASERHEVATKFADDLLRYRELKADRN